MVKAESGLRTRPCCPGTTSKRGLFVLDVSRSHMTALRTRKADWVDRRKAPPRPDDDQLLSEIIAVAKDLPTYGYRRVWAILKLQGIDGTPRLVNHKRVYRVMRDNNLLFRHGSKPRDTRRHDGKVAVPTSDTRWCSDGLELPCDNGEKVRVAFALDCCDRGVMS